MSVKPVRIGIVGLGFMAATHIRAYQKTPGSLLASFCSPSGRHLDGDFTNVAGNIATGDPLKVDMASIRACRKIEELIEDPAIDLIDICTPTTTHKDLAIAALRAGKHVLCEKPLARTSAEALEIERAAANAKGILMPAMCLRFWPEWAWVQERIRSGEYGRVLAARFRRVAEPPAWGAKHFGNGAMSGGALLDLHVHDTDFVQFAFGRPKSVFSRGYTKHTGAVDHVVTQYDVEGGAIVHAEGSWAMTKGFGFNMSYTINFERATADYDIARGADALKLAGEGETARVVKCEGPDGYAAQAAHLLDRINAGAKSAAVTAADGRASVEICEAEERSVRSGRVEEVRYAS
jgi:predicted dehydrogenase